jgi:hypothetical protein
VVWENYTWASGFWLISLIALLELRGIQNQSYLNISLIQSKLHQHTPNQSSYTISLRTELNFTTVQIEPKLS